MTSMITTKIGHIASIPDREESLRLVVRSVYSQLDELHVMLNCYREVPGFLNKAKIKVYQLDNSLGDSAKFHNVDLHKGYLFFFDDDIVYPKNYITDCISIHQAHKHSHIVSFHGVRYHTKEVTNYYHETKRTKYHCMSKQNGDAFVDIGGTGVMSFHSSTIDVKISDFQAPNMADIWLAKVAKEAGVKILVPRHEADYFMYIPQNRTIYDDYENNCELQTSIVNKYIL